MPDIDLDQLVATALEARKRAYAPYSQFQVGAALLCDDGKVFTGVNVENASYGLCLCAERTALATAVAAGYSRERFLALSVVADTPGPASPCGACRQWIAELLPADAPVVMENLSGARQISTQAELLPGAFAPEDMAQ